MIVLKYLPCVKLASYSLIFLMFIQTSMTGCRRQSGSKSGSDGTSTGADTGTTAGITGGATMGSPGNPNDGGGLVNGNIGKGAKGSLESSQIRYFGRVDRTSNGGYAFGWPLSGFEVKVDGGTYLRLTLLNQQRLQNNFFDVFINNELKQTIQILDAQKVYQISLGAASGARSVRVLKRNEAGNGKGILARLDTDGTLVNVDVGSGRLIEFVGDTLMNGYGVLGQSGKTECALPPNTVADPNLQDPKFAYPYLVGQAFNAEVSLIASTSRGIYRNLSGAQGDTLPDLYLRADPIYTTPEWDFRTKPQVIVINAGNYDSVYWLGAKLMPEVDGFVSTYINFVQKQVRAKNPDAYILLTWGPQLSNFQCFGGWQYSSNGSNTPCVNTDGSRFPGALDVMKQAMQQIVEKLKAGGDRKVEFLEFPTDGKNVTCDYVPDKVGHQNISRLLIEKITQVTNWNKN
jgi:hypothetical protein